MADSAANGEVIRNRFGTFGGVFTPSMLTIFGLIMFMRANYVVGNAGVYQALLILTLCCSITFLTGLSISAISTNTPVKGGGAYFLISRVLGPGFGTSIGIALFLAQAVSVPFYILGFTEALVDSFDLGYAPNDWRFLALTLGILLVLFIMVWIGAGWVIKVQYVILAVLVGAIVVFMVGAWQVFDLGTFQTNTTPHYEEGRNFWRIFAIYFPAVTGIMAGVNMSGDLRDPAKSIPTGTLAAIVVGFLAYGAQVVICGGMASHRELIAQPFLLLKDNAAFNLGGLVIAGVFCATISSAIGSKLGAPRVLQAVARDGVLRVLAPFAKGTQKGDEPRQALLVTFLISAVVLVVAKVVGQEGLNIVAAVVTMIFLYTYGMTNLAAFVESMGLNPSFRPRFKFFHWTTALTGAIACIWTAFMINTIAAALAIAFIMALFFVVRNKEMSEAHGDARRGFIYSRVSTNLTKLAGMPMHPKNWRPTIAVFAGRPNQRTMLVEYARWIGQQTGIVSLVNVVVGKLEKVQEEVNRQRRLLLQFVRDNELEVFPEIIVMEDFDRDLKVFLQAHSIGPIKPNVILFGWAQTIERLPNYYDHLRTVEKLGKSLLVLVDHGMMIRRGRRKRIDIWWRGQQNGSLMIIVAHLLTLNEEWDRTRIRLLRQVQTEDEVEAAETELRQIAASARVRAGVCVPVSTQPFASVLEENSADATLIMLGLSPPGKRTQLEFHNNMEDMLRNMPTTMLVHSSGEADLQA